jgi:hypothetical protein
MQTPNIVVKEWTYLGPSETQHTIPDTQKKRALQLSLPAEKEY